MSGGTLRTTTRVRRQLAPPTLHFFGQEGQDLCLAQTVFHGRTGGFYVDLASNDARLLSNSHAFDRIYNWSGLCIEPQRQYYRGYVRHRTCTLAQLLVGSGEIVHFESHNGTSEEQGESRVLPPDAVAKGATLRARTVPLGELFAAAGVPRHIDYLSLDVEGYELHAMQTFPWGTHSVGALTVERPGAALHALLLERGFCVALNGANFVDLLYLSDRHAHAETGQCAGQYPMPAYVHRRDICGARRKHAPPTSAAPPRGGHPRLPGAELAVGARSPRITPAGDHAGGSGHVCAETTFGEAGDCRHGGKGMWFAYSQRECLARCSRCAQCRHVAFSQRDLDCSWYRHCAHPKATPTDHRILSLRGANLTALALPLGAQAEGGIDDPLQTWPMRLQAAAPQRSFAAEVGRARWPSEPPMCLAETTQAAAALAALSTDAHPPPPACSFVVRAPEYGVFCSLHYLAHAAVYASLARCEVHFTPWRAWRGAHCRSLPECLFHRGSDRPAEVSAARHRHARAASAAGALDSPADASLAGPSRGVPELRLLEGHAGSPRSWQRFWLYAKALRAAWRPRRRLAKLIDELTATLGLPVAAGTAAVGSTGAAAPALHEAVGLHVRDGDACTPIGEREGRRCDGLDEYMPSVRRMAAELGTNHVVLATDGGSAIVNQTSRYPEFRWHHRDARALDAALAGQRAAARAASAPMLHAALLEGRGRLDAAELAVGTVAEATVLSRCRGLVGKFTSNMFRAVVEMAAAERGCVPPFASIDASWCGDAGVTSGHVEAGPMAGKQFRC